MQVLVAQLQSVNWWSENKDIFALCISLAALVWSILSTRQTMDRTERIARETSDNNARMARISTYQRIHETLVAPEASKGRRQLFLSYRQGKFPSLGTGSWDEINYSLALYDTLGGYLFHGQVDEDIVLAAWHHPLQNIAEPIRAFMLHRKEQNIHQPWTYLHHLINRAQQYECQCPAEVAESQTNDHDN